MTRDLPPPHWPTRGALFLDVDGTLLELVARPDAVETPDRVRRILERLERLDPPAVAFISGRSMADLDRLLTPHRFAVAAVHGSERRDLRGKLSVVRSERAALNVVRPILRGFASANAGALVEDKSISVALHYRQRPDLLPAVRQLADALSRILPDHYELLHGSMVVEIKPTAASKGTAIRAFMQEAPFATRIPMFIGDDITDETGFRVINELGGISVKVGAGPSEARYRLSGVPAVLAWLEQLIADQVVASVVNVGMAAPSVDRRTDEAS
jgi:trehalose 6-phosphate phosphatase